MQDELSHIAHLFLSRPDSSSKSLTIRALVTEHLPDPAPAIRQIAAHFARQLGSTALLQFDNAQAVLSLFSTTGIAPKHPSARNAPHAQADELSAALAALPKHTGLLLLSLDTASPLLAQCPQISVVVSPQSKIMVDAYSQIKRLAHNTDQALGLTMVDCLSVVQGRSLAERLCQAAREFLGLILRLDAVVLRTSRLRQRKLAQADSVDQRTLIPAIGSLAQA